MYEDRVEKAVTLFKEGYNCAQAVCGAYGDLYGFTFEQSIRMAASFGGGIGRMRQTCGAACGMFIVAGLATPADNVEATKGKGNNYKLVQELAEKFKNMNGSLICAELLGLSTKVEHTDTNREARTAEYYKKRPCPEMVRSAAQIWADYLTENN